MTQFLPPLHALPTTPALHRVQWPPGAQISSCPQSAVVLHAQPEPPALQVSAQIGRTGRPPPGLQTQQVHRCGQLPLLSQPPTHVLFDAHHAVPPAQRGGPLSTLDASVARASRGSTDPSRATVGSVGSGAPSGTPP